jgi:hypothetical protein
MSPKTLAAPKKSAEPKKHKNTPAAAGGEHPQTGDLDLKGGKDGKTIGLDGKTVLTEAVPPEVYSAAKGFALAKDRASKYQKDVKEQGQKFLDAAIKFQVSTKTKIKVELDSGWRQVSLRQVLEGIVENVRSTRGKKNSKNN